MTISGDVYIHHIGAMFQYIGVRNADVVGSLLGLVNNGSFNEITIFLHCLYLASVRDVFAASPAV